MDSFHCRVLRINKNPSQEFYLFFRSTVISEVFNDLSDLELVIFQEPDVERGLYGVSSVKVGTLSI